MNTKHRLEAVNTRLEIKSYNCQTDDIFTDKQKFEFNLTLNIMTSYLDDNDYFEGIDVQPVTVDRFVYLFEINVLVFRLKLFSQYFSQSFHLFDIDACVFCLELEVARQDTSDLDKSARLIHVCHVMLNPLRARNWRAIPIFINDRENIGNNWAKTYQQLIRRLFETSMMINWIFK